MASQRTDVVVLGAGIVGVSAALHLQAKGRAVTLVDRAGAAATETSFGNTGIVQSEAVFPLCFRAAETCGEDRLALDDAGVAEAGLGRRRAGAVDHRHRASPGLRCATPPETPTILRPNDDVGSLQSHAGGLRNAPRRREARAGLNICAVFL